MKRIFAVAILALGLAFTGLVAAPSHASASTTPKRLIALRWAEAQAGKPYIWGGMGPSGFDCSGLTMSAWRHAGVTLPRTTFAMLGSWHLVPEPVSQAQPGDLMFFGSGHVELKTRPWNGTFGALEPGTSIGWHRWSGWWRPTMAFRVR